MSMFDLKHPPPELDDAQDRLPRAAPRPAGGPGGVALNCMGGAAGPADLRDDIEALMALPDPIKQRLWEVLLPYLHPAPAEADQQRVGALCEEHGLDPQRLVGPVRAVRFLLQQSARAALDRGAFAGDLSALAPEGRIHELLEILLPCFDRAMPPMRREIVARTLAEHGRLVETTHWRVDKILGSEHGDGIDVPVAVLTFAYRESAGPERVTLHFLPEQLAQLREICDRMLAGSAPRPR
jgi:hypothetical protein